MISNDKYSSYMRKFLLLVMIIVHKTCNPTILNLSIVKRKDKFRIVVLQAQNQLYTIDFVDLYIYIYIYICI